MKKPFENSPSWEEKRSRVIGLGNKSSRKSFYPQLQNRLGELEKFRVLIDKISDSLFILQLPSAQINEVNVSVVNLLCLPEEDILQKSIFDFLDAEVSTRLRFWIESIKDLKKSNSISVSTNIKNNCGKIIPVEINFDTSEFNNEYYCIAIVRDITDRKKNEDALILAQEEAVHADKLKTEFLAQMSHEIRTPVHTILSFTNLLESELGSSLPEDYKESFQLIDGAGERLIRTIDSILNMSQVQTGVLKIVPEKFNVLEPINSLFQEYELKGKTKGLSFKKYVNTKNTDVYADKYCIIQILENLLNNALKYTIEGNVDLIVDRDEKNNLFFEVEDTGIGISEKYLPSLFNPFSQEEQGYTRKFDGNGLGLALVNKYCDLNNAKISVKSKKNIGTSFRVTFTLE